MTKLRFIENKDIQGRMIIIIKSPYKGHDKDLNKIGKFSDHKIFL